MSLFNVNIDKLNLLVLPTWLRRPAVHAFCQSLSAPMRSIYKRFMERRRQVLFRLKYDSSVYNIERYLNKTFSDGGTDIYITNADRPSGSYLTSYLPFFITDPNHYGVVQRAYLTQSMPFYIDEVQKGIDFTVHIPSSLAQRADDIRSAVSGLALPSYSFEIVTY